MSSDPAHHERRDLEEIVDHIRDKETSIIIQKLTDDPSWIHCIDSISSWSLIKYAIFDGNEELFDYLLKNMQHDVVPLDAIEETSLEPTLMFCVRNGSLYMLNKVIEKFQNVNFQTRDTKITSLHAAVHHHYQSSDRNKRVKLLLKSGADKRLRDLSGYMPIHYIGQDYKLKNIFLKYGNRPEDEIPN